MRDRILVRHFLQRFLDHDLISPDADRREVLTVTGAIAVASMLCLAVFVAAQYQFSLFLPPGLTSLFSLDDRFLFCAISFVVMALIAVAEWDALALDPRDAAVLGPLPITRPAIVRAKVAALALFAIGFDVALSVGPAVLRIAALPQRLPVTFRGAATLTAAQAVCTLAAGGFGFVAVLALREGARAVLGRRVFARMSGGLHASLVVLLVTTLLLLPRSYSSVAARWLAHGRVAPRALPPLWFVGLHETLAGAVIDNLPHVSPPRRFAAAEQSATILYRSLWPLFHQLAAVAVVGSLAALAVAALACWWNHRRLPIAPPSGSNGRGRLARACAAIARRAIVRDPAAQAGFFFTLQTLSRSVPHRVTAAASVAVALALGVMTAGSLDARAGGHGAQPIRLFALEPWLLMVLLAGFRHVVRVPAEARANWMFHLAWSGDERPYLAGVKRAALVVIVAPALVLMCAWYLLVAGRTVALEQLLTGACLAALLLQLLFLGYRKLPFASAYVRGEDVKSAIPLFVAGTLTAGAMLAAVERMALATPAGAAAFFLAFFVAIAAVTAVDRSRRRGPSPIDLNEMPADPTQRLALNQ